MRLFVAVNLPPTVRRALWDRTAELRGRSYPVKWVGGDALHLTLKFLGEVLPEREPEVLHAIEVAVPALRPFTLPIGGFGAFPNARRARVLWVGCGRVVPLETTQRRLEEEIHRIGFPKETRPFHPHITLGRVRQGVRAAQLRGLDAELEGLEFTAEVEVVSVDLMQSELSRAGARYTVRHAIPLPT